MVYNFSLEKMPEIKSTYTVRRNSVWQVADPYHILLTVLDGECDIKTNGCTYRIKKGSSIFIPANQVYKRTPVRDKMCEMMYVHFTVGTTHELSSAEALFKINRLKSDAESALLNSENTFVASLTDVFLSPAVHIPEGKSIEICKKIKDLRYGYKIDSTLFLLIYFCELLALLSKHTLDELKEDETDAHTVKTPYNLKKAIWYIKQNYSKKITLYDLCIYCNISQSQLTRYFKQTFSTTPMQYITQFKINRAREMFLNSPGLSVKSVCCDLGFDDQHYFSRIFTKLTGETPTAYKARVAEYSPKKLI